MFVVVVACGRLCLHPHVESAGLRKIEGAGMGALATSVTTLTSLSLATCSQFDEWTYQAVARGSPRLRHLNLNHCPKVSDEAIKVGWLRSAVFVVGILMNRTCAKERLSEAMQ